MNESQAPGHSEAEQLGRDWWRTAIIDMQPGVIRYRGYAIEDLIRQQTSLTQMVWLMTRGELPTPAQAGLLEAALMAAVDHGPQAPSIAITRMAATCGVGLNSAMASGLNVLGDVHGGAGEQALALYQQVALQMDAGSPMHEAVRSALDAHVRQHGKAIPGFGHRFHPVDPRTAPLLERVEEAVAKGVVTGRFAAIARGIEDTLAAGRPRRIPMNIDGVTAVIYGELGFPAPLARGLFCLSRSVGLLAHAWEQMQEGERIKGPLPKAWTPTYDGPPARGVPDSTREG
jgi:citrate synthase